MAFVDELKKELEVLSRIREHYIYFYIRGKGSDNHILHEELYRIYTWNIPELLYKIFNLLNVTGIYQEEEFDPRQTREWLSDSKFCNILQEVYLSSPQQDKIQTLLQEISRLKKRSGIIVISIENDLPDNNE